MVANYFDSQEIIAKNIIAFSKEKGYSRLSLSKVMGISRTEIEHLLSAQNTDVSVYNSKIEQFNKVFELPGEYLITPTKTSLLPPTIVADERSEFVQELFDGLNNILDVYSMYLNED